MAKKTDMADTILDLTIKFHNTYGKLASDFNIKGIDIKDFNINTDNDKLLFATVEHCMMPVLFELDSYKDKQAKIKKNIKKFVEIGDYSEESVRDNYKKLMEILNIESGADDK